MQSETMGAAGDAEESLLDIFGDDEDDLFDIGNCGPWLQAASLLFDSYSKSVTLLFIVFKIVVPRPCEWGC